MNSNLSACRRIVILAALACAPLIALSADAPERYTVFVAVQPPYGKNRPALQKMLKAEGYESGLEGDEELVMVLTAAELGKLFQAKVRMQTVAASASDRSRGCARGFPSGSAGGR